MEPIVGWGNSKMGRELGPGEEAHQFINISTHQKAWDGQIYSLLLLSSRHVHIRTSTPGNLRTTITDNKSRSRFSRFEFVVMQPGPWNCCCLKEPNRKLFVESNNSRATCHVFGSGVSSDLPNFHYSQAYWLPSLPPPYGHYAIEQYAVVLGRAARSFLCAPELETGASLSKRKQATSRGWKLQHRLLGSRP
ncbi:hypothetical protein BJX64DRAFT_58419 [Aspergillus heterothallicus]